MRPDLKFNSSLDTLADLLQAGGNVRNAEAGRAAALSFLSLCAGRRYVTEFDDAVHLHTALIAPSLSEVRHFKSSLSTVSIAVGLGKSVRTSRLSSPSAVYSSLYKQPNLLYVADDYGSQLAFAKRQPAGVLEQALHGLSDCFDNKAILIDNPMEFQIKSAPQDGCTIYMPSVTLLAMIPEGQASLLLSTHEIGRGALEQFIFVYADPLYTELSEPQPVVWPEWIGEHVRRIRNTVPVTDTSSLINDHPEQIPDTRRVAFAIKPDSRYAELMLLSEHPLARNILISSRVLLRRVSALIAIWRNPETPIVIDDDLDYSFRFVKASVELMIDRLKLLSSDEGKLSLMQKVLSVIDKSGDAGIVEGRLRDYCRAFKSLSKEDREKLLTQLTEDGDIIQKPTSNRKGVLLVSAKFVEEIYPTQTTQTQHRHNTDDDLFKQSHAHQGAKDTTQTTQTLFTLA